MKELDKLYWKFIVGFYGFMSRFTKTLDEDAELQITLGIRNEDFSPNHCWNCGCDEFKRKNIIFDESFGTLEYELHCNNCGKTVGCWAYGSWNID